MARALTTGFIAEATAAVNRPVMLFEGVFKTSTLRIWNGFGDLSYAGNTWLGNGWFQGIEGGEETASVEAETMAVVLSGVSGTLISLILSDQKQGAAGTLLIGFITAAGAVLPDPYKWWVGKYSHAELEDGADQATVRLHYEAELVDLDRAREGRWTHDSQQRIFPGDLGFSFVVAAADWKGDWGAERKKPARTTKKPLGGPSRGGRTNR